VVELAPAAPLPSENALADPAWRLDPKVAEQVEETLSTLTLRRRRFLRNYLASGNIGGSVRGAGYQVTSPSSASEMGRHLLRDPKVAFCVQAIAEAEGIGSAAKLQAIIGHHMSRFDSCDSGDRDRSLRAASLVYKIVRRATPSAPIAGSALSGRGSLDQLLDQLSPIELRRLADHGVWPKRLAPFLRATTEPPLLDPPPEPESAPPASDPRPPPPRSHPGPQRGSADRTGYRPRA